MIEPKREMKELRKFALTMFCALGILGSILLWRKRDTGVVLLGIGAATLLMAWVHPKVLRPVYRYWMKLALVLGLISSHVILALLYYLVFTPIGLAMRIFGKNPLVLRPDEGIESYWITRGGGKFDKERCEKMF